MDQFLTISQLLVAVATLVTLFWGLLKMFEASREAKGSREEVKKVVKSAEMAATAAHQEVKSMALDIRKIEVSSNSMKDALVAVTEKEAFARGQKDSEEKRE